MMHSLFIHAQGIVDAPEMVNTSPAAVGNRIGSALVSVRIPDSAARCQMALVNQLPFCDVWPASQLPIL